MKYRSVFIQAYFIFYVIDNQTIVFLVRCVPIIKMESNKNQEEEKILFSSGNLHKKVLKTLNVTELMDPSITYFMLELVYSFICKEPALSMLSLS